MRDHSLNAALLAATLFVADAAQAQERQAYGEIRIYEENDLFNPFSEPTDRYYTQGLRVEWLSPPQRHDAHFLPGIAYADWCRLVCGHGAVQGSVNTGYAFGQNIYTPADISIAAPQPYDRPWAGLLYGSRIARITYDEPSLAAQRQDRIEVSLGIVGPASLAREAQTVVHQLKGVGLPQGWDNQLSTEPVLQLRYDTALRWPRTNGGHADVIARVRGNLGNELISLEAEVTGRIGWNLSGFGVPINPSAAMPATLQLAGPAGAGTGTGWLSSGNLFARAGIKAVAHNIFLDGNTFADNDIRIDRTVFVPEIAVGAELNLVGDFSLTAQFVHRGSEFESWNGRKAPGQEFGAITVAWALRR
jgi:hypothetical protein